MDRNRFKTYRRTKRRRRVRRKVFGSPDRPRLSVYRSLRNVYAQIVDDTRGVTIAQACSLELVRSGDLDATKAGNSEGASVVGEALAARAKDAGVSRVTFDRGGYKYHGRVKALADGARKGGLEF
jgi:large subunit ribosomal protein L18